MTEEADFSGHIAEGKNKTNVHCQFCNSLMLKAQEGVYSKEEVSAGCPLLDEQLFTSLVSPGGSAPNDAEAG